MTKREMFETLMAMESVKANAEIMEKLAHEIELLNNKSNSKKPTKSQLANVGIKAEILETLKNADEPLTVTQIIKIGNFEEEVTNQKITSLLKQLTNEVVRIEEKGRAYYSVA